MRAAAGELQEGGDRRLQVGDEPRPDELRLAALVALPRKPRTPARPASLRSALRWPVSCAKAALLMLRVARVAGAGGCRWRGGRSASACESCSLIACDVGGLGEEGRRGHLVDLEQDARRRRVAFGIGDMALRAGEGLRRGVGAEARRRRVALHALDRLHRLADLGGERRRAARRSAAGRAARRPSRRCGSRLARPSRPRRPRRAPRRACGRAPA